MFSLLHSFLISRKMFKLVLPYFLMPPRMGTLLGGREQNFPGNLNGNPNQEVMANIDWVLTVGKGRGECITLMWPILRTDKKAEAQERLSDLSEVTGLSGGPRSKTKP